MKRISCISVSALAIVLSFTTIRASSQTNSNQQKITKIKKQYKKAYTPESVRTLFLEYVEAGDLDGVMSVFEDDAVVVLGGDNPILRGKEQFRPFYAKILESKPKFVGLQNRPEIINGNIALTSTKIPNVMVTVEVSRKQPDGSWLWIIDQPTIAIEP